ncbi:MAG: Spore coat protein SA [Flavobacterium sp. SCGC AAA160-P02]|nr:MAG: Spore coat protein SA [Flavobacterium sp. SCGC AAA160-P02]
MRIIIVNTLYAPYNIGGAEKSVQTLAESFSRKGNDVIVVSLGEEDAQYKLNEISIYKIKIKNDYWPYDSFNRGSLQKLKWHLKDSSNYKYNTFFKNLFLRYKPDILLTNNISGFSTKVWCVASKLNIKIVHTLRDYYLQCPKSTKFNNNFLEVIISKLLSFPKKKDSVKVNFLVGISNYILTDHIKNGYFKGIQNKVIYNGFDFDKERFNNKKNNNTFGFIGQINKPKGIELMLESFSKINDSSWKLLIAGKIDNSYLNYLKNINDSTQIEYLGYIDSSDFFEMIDVLIVPSLWNEPFGRVVVESLIHKKPVIASCRGGIPELLLNNKEFVFTPDIDGLTTILKKIIFNSNFLKEFRFQKNFLDKFNIDQTVQQYLDVFKEIVKD